jgi:hypothetical protein
VRHLRFIKGAVLFIYEVRLSYHGLGWSAFFQSSSAGSGGAGEILLLWGDAPALSLSSGSDSLFCLF